LRKKAVDSRLKKPSHSSAGLVLYPYTLRDQQILILVCAARSSTLLINICILGAFWKDLPLLQQQPGIQWVHVFGLVEYPIVKFQQESF
jgi:hypothetical protein